MVKTWAVVPSADKHGTLSACLDALLPQCPVVVVDTDGEWRYGADRLSAPGLAMVPAATPKNISAWWNHGIQVATLCEPSVEFIAIVNDDAIVPPGWVHALAHNMAINGTAIGWTINRGLGRVQLQPDNANRVTGWAFMVRSHARFDESMRWWYSDNDMEWQAYDRGGASVLAGWPVTHLHPNEGTNADPELLEQTARDRERFLAKWGKLPH